MPDISSFHIISNSAPKVFELTETALVNIRVDFKCTAMSCYGDAGDVMCPAPDLVKPYLKIIGISDGFVYLVKNHEDFRCLLQSADCAPDQELIGIEGAYCGVTSNQVIQLNPGRYLIDPTPEPGFEVNVSLGYDQNISFVPYSEDIIAKGGGLRIKEIRDHDGIDPANDKIRSYQYQTTSANGPSLSTGKLMTFLNYFEFRARQYWDIGPGGGGMFGISDEAGLVTCHTYIGSASTAMDGRLQATGLCQSATPSSVLGMALRWTTATLKR